MPRLEFTHRHLYALQTEGIALPVILKSGAEAVDVLASVWFGAKRTNGGGYGCEQLPV
jgi:hypothetical protein